ncbi:hypothetical protein CP8484711_1325A, partial [Chlamydia psittaci 84-8471/1]
MDNNLSDMASMSLRNKARSIKGL